MKDTYAYRSDIIRWIFAVSTLLLVLQSARLQLFDDTYQKIAQQTTINKKVIEPARGIFYDRTGKVLTYNDPVYDLMCTRNLVHEMDTTLLDVVSSIKSDLRMELDIAARVGEEDFVLALPGVALDRAEEIASSIKRNILFHVTTPSKISVEIGIGCAEYSDHAESLAEEALMGGDEVETLLNIAIGKCLESTIT